MNGLAHLKSLRLRKALTQQQLADKAGVNRATILHLEGGKVEPVPSTVRKLADALGVGPEDLMDTGASVIVPSPDIAAGRLVRDHAVEGADTAEVAPIFNQNPGLVELVAEAADQIAGFIPSAHLHLERLSDPEYGDQEQLFLGVSATLEENEALTALRRFDQEWWVRQAYRAHGHLCIDLVDE